MASPHSTTVKYAQHHHRYLVIAPGSLVVGRFDFDPDDPKSRHEAHEAACEEMRRRNGGADPLLERLHERRAAFERQAWNSEGQKGGLAPTDAATGLVNWGSGPAKGGRP